MIYLLPGRPDAPNGRFKKKKTSQGVWSIVSMSVKKKQQEKEKKKTTQVVYTYTLWVCVYRHAGSSLGEREANNKNPEKEKWTFSFQVRVMDTTTGWQWGTTGCKEEMERLMVVKTRFINASRCQLQLERSRRRRRRENKPTPPFLFASPLSLSLCGHCERGRLEILTCSVLFYVLLSLFFFFKRHPATSIKESAHSLPSKKKIPFLPVSIAHFFFFRKKRKKKRT